MLKPIDLLIETHPLLIYYNQPELLGGNYKECGPSTVVTTLYAACNLLIKFEKLGQFRAEKSIHQLGVHTMYIVQYTL